MMAMSDDKRFPKLPFDLVSVLVLSQTGNQKLITTVGILNHIYLKQWFSKGGH